MLLKLTEQDRKALLVAVFPAIVALKLTTAPAARDGTAKKVSADFAAAVWTRRYVDTLCNVLEKEDVRAAEAAEAPNSSGFPS